MDQTVGTTQIGLDASSMDIFGVGLFPIGDKFEVFAKAGYAFIDLDVSVSDPLLGSINGSTSEDDFAYGAGFSFKVGDKFALRAEYEAFDVIESADMISVGGIFRF
jgi:opacity protein-like surface antigen